jgi:hypothetical protein
MDLPERIMRKTEHVFMQIRIYIEEPRKTAENKQRFRNSANAQEASKKCHLLVDRLWELAFGFFVGYRWCAPL